jgi:hypothetical protein
MYSKEMKDGTKADMSTPIFIAALYAKARKCEQLKYPSTDECINKMRCTHNRISFSCKMEGNSDTIMHHG